MSETTSNWYMERVKKKQQESRQPELTNRIVTKTETVGLKDLDIIYAEGDCLFTFTFKDDTKILVSANDMGFWEAEEEE